MSQIETPYPIEGSIEIESDAVTSWSLPCVQEWMSEHESGDIAAQIRNDMRANHGVGYKAEFIVYRNGRYDLLEVEEIDG